MLVACCVHQGISVNCSENNCLVFRSEMKRKKNIAQKFKTVELENALLVSSKEEEMRLEVVVNFRSTFS